jgi:hypothetical protein
MNRMEDVKICIISHPAHPAILLFSLVASGFVPGRMLNSYHEVNIRVLRPK